MECTVSSGEPKGALRKWMHQANSDPILQERLAVEMGVEFLESLHLQKPVKKKASSDNSTVVDSKLIYHGRGSNCYDRPPNHVFLNHLARYKPAYQSIPNGKGERLLKREFQKQRLEEIVDILGFQFHREENGQKRSHERDNSSTCSRRHKKARIERDLEKIRAVLSRTEPTRLAFPGPSDICLDKGAAVDLHPPNIFLRNLVKCSRDEYKQEGRVFARNLFGMITRDLQYRFIQRKQAEDPASLWTEASKDEGFRFLVQELEGRTKLLKECSMSSPAAVDSSQ